jgi:hypothetical protein
MATPRTLTERLEAIINSPEATPLKGRLIKLLRSVKLLESGHAARKKEAKIAALKAQNEDLRIRLQAVQAQIDQYRAEQAQQDEKKQGIDPTQFTILQRLASESECHWLKIDEIARAVKIPVDEAEIYVNGLKKLGLASFHPHEPGGGGWHRTAEGNTLVVAKRWAGEEEEPKEKKRKHADLSKPQEIALLMTARHNGDGATEPEIAQQLGISVLAARLVLKVLREKEMATDGDEPQADYGTGEIWWWILKDGMEYLSERGKL